ncbi:acyltransferase family protein, partial [Mycobacterium alsense]|uniref:acyltransferase family protein n=1 Tax=Mycobacterium alsense TaxID=324058 RepID=UPI001F6141F1
EQFYLVWPALIIGTTWLVRRVRRRAQADAPSLQRPYLVVLAIVGALSFAASLVLTQVLPPMAFFSLPTRAWELAAGGLVALTVGRWRRLPTWPAAAAGWAGLSLILLSCCYLSPNTPYPGSAALLPVLGTALVIGAGCAAPSQGCGRVLAISPMRAVGRVSYSWYLWHWPVLQVVPASATGHSLGQRLASVLVSLGLAFLTLRFIEDPLRFAAPLRRSANRSLAVGGTATTIAVVVGVALLVGMPVPVGRGPAASAPNITAASPPTGSSVAAYDAAVRDAFAQVQAAVAASVELKAVPSNLTPPLAGVTAEVKSLYLHGCLRNLFEVGQPECASGDTNSPTTVALVGDSNAYMWEPALQKVAEQRHWRLETLTKGACPLLDLPVNNPVLGREYTECQRWRGQIIARLQAERPRLVVLSIMRQYGARYGFSSGFTSYDSAWIDSLKRQVRDLQASGAKVLVLGPIPDPQSAVPECLSAHLDDATACS